VGGDCKVSNKYFSLVACLFKPLGRMFEISLLQFTVQHKQLLLQ
jgi:hypothetical protein